MAKDGYLIEVKTLRMFFPVLAGVMRRKVADVRAVDDISFYIKKGETLLSLGEAKHGAKSPFREWRIAE